MLTLNLFNIYLPRIFAGYSYPDADVVLRQQVGNFFGPFNKAAGI